VKLPRRPLTNIDIEKYVKLLKIPHFRGVFMRDNLPTRPHIKECAIANLDSVKNPGTHWVAYIKRSSDVLYFDPFGDLTPTLELQKYLRGSKIRYNSEKFQNYNSFNCGHLCLKFLYANTKWCHTRSPCAVIRRH